MAEQMPSKRQREETQSSNEELVEETKRHKSYNHTLSLLEAEEVDQSQDVSSLITSLQQQLSSDSVLDVPFPPTTTPLKAHDQQNPAGMTNSNCMVSIEDRTTATSSLKGDEDLRVDDKEQVIRHLLEASDDELGIPNRESVLGVEFDEGFDNGGNGFALCDGLWELEDEAANYYTLLQSELFM
ncbi:anaphase-promoting complex subunit 2-like [Hibiscus syriacus]|uniref:Anaphase-promoting complex subunit 2-like n=1 Tax=Hibiscus syriacus TaxID=106335 RepID=A0A6A2YUD9_HIBSY|nr:uncharacterized protein LOC120156398 [Hibiscus syriacus]KAE8683074.1 anaphase-promoting complex subunit 2-like [Hibiscus syriacus]